VSSTSIPNTARKIGPRLPMLAAGMLSMAYGAWLGLVRIGWNLPLPSPDGLIGHGPLMVCGFLGTLISLERAVALGATWGYAAPAAVASGTLILIAGFAPSIAAAVITLGSGVLVAVYVAVWLRQPSLFIATMGLGAAMWIGGNIRWLTGAAILRVVPWWLAFLVLTIAGERLELNRVLRPTQLVRLAFILSVSCIVAGVVATVRWPEMGLRLAGAGLIALAIWLFLNDVARRTVRQRGLPRFIALCLLAGYAWLIIAGGIAIVSGVSSTGLVYDALLHSILLGFVMSMVFGHAPIIFPAIVGIPVPYRPAFFLHVGLLHASVLLRIVGDLVDVLGRWRIWGGLLNAIALSLFAVNTVRAIASGRPQRYPVRSVPI
jgi:hypothetical protein